MSEQNPKVGIGVYILNDNRQLLLGKRKNSHGDGSWSPPGGHLEFMESVEECAKREVMEEIGITLKDVKEIVFTEDFYQDENKHYISIHVRAVMQDGKIEALEKDKCERWEWFDLNNLPNPIFISASNFLDKYKELL